MATLAKNPVKGNWDMQEGENWDAYAKRTDKMFKELEDAAKNIPEGSIIGALLSFPVADGSAIYRVSKEKPLTLEHVPYCDAWQIPHTHIRGVRKADVLESIRASRAMAKIFGG